MTKLIKFITIIAFCSIFSLSLNSIVNACSRFTYSGLKQTVITARSMDWTENLHTDLWVFPAGITRVGDEHSMNAVKWISKYGSIIASAYNLGAADGMNSAGLSVNLLYLSTAEYGKPIPNRKDLSLFNWAQYVLDNYANVNDAVKGLNDQQFNMIAPTLPNGASPSFHLAITDSTGDNAVFEHIKGKLVIHHGKQYKVMTNEPTYDKQLALTEYWERLKGAFLPGTGEPDDRFVRASYYVNDALQTDNEQQAVATVFSIIRNVSVPMGAVISGRPNVAATLWRTVADLKHMVYYFEDTDRPNVFWIDLNKMNLKAGAPTMKLSLSNNEVYAGEVSNHFVNAIPTFGGSAKSH